MLSDPRQPEFYVEWCDEPSGRRFQEVPDEHVRQLLADYERREVGSGTAAGGGGAHSGAQSGGHDALPKYTRYERAM